MAVNLVFYACVLIAILEVAISIYSSYVVHVDTLAYNEKVTELMEGER